MSLYFDWNLTLLQEILLLLLLLLTVCELLYLYLIYDRVSRYRRRVLAGGVRYADALPGISVIIYADAENSAGVEDTLNAILEQDYQAFEVIVVNNDMSEEGHHAVSVIECAHDNVYQTFVPDAARNISRRKLGITLGVKAARHDIVLVTEANCRPVGNRWLRKMARNFVPGVDVVLGYTRMRERAGGGAREARCRIFDRLTFALRYLSFAAMHRPYMGVCGNLAYRKECFFAHNGFSSSLNLHYGDDDLFINEIADSHNTRIEVSPHSIVDARYADNRKAWDELRLKYNFTARYLHTPAKVVFAMETPLHYLFWLVAVSAVVAGLPGLLCAVVALLLLVAYWVVTCRVYRRAGKLLGERYGTAAAPLWLLLRPFSSLRYAIMGRKENKSYFTWQYLR